MHMAGLEKSSSCAALLSPSKPLFCSLVLLTSQGTIKPVLEKESFSRELLSCLFLRSHWQLNSCQWVYNGGLHWPLATEQLSLIGSAVHAACAGVEQALHTLQAWLLKAVTIA